MDIWSIDYWAVAGRSILHRASALSKLLAAGLLITAIVATEDIFALLAIYLTLAAGVVVARLPVLQVLAIAAYPVVFALLFAVSRWHGSLLDPLLIIAKTMTAAATMVLLISTTPYPQLFAVVRHLLPEIVAEGLFLTYRSFFVLLMLLTNLTNALRLRGGLSQRHYLSNARNLAAGLALLLVRAIALSERVHDVLRLRGYSGRLAVRPLLRRITAFDLLPLGVGILLLGAVLTMRFAPGAFQYNGYLLVAAFLTLLAALLGRESPSPPRFFP